MLTTSEKRLKPIIEHLKNENTQSINASVDASLAVVNYEFAPAIGTLACISAIQIELEGLNLGMSKYGSINGGLTNGIFVNVLDANDNILLTLTQDPIKNNSELVSVFSDHPTPFLSFGTGNDLLTPRMNLFSVGSDFIIDGRVGERLVFVLNDDFSTIPKHEFLIRGRYLNVEM